MDKDHDDLLDMRLKLIKQIDALEAQVSKLAEEEAHFKAEVEMCERRLQPHALTIAVAGFARATSPSKRSFEAKGLSELRATAEKLAAVDFSGNHDSIALQCAIIELEACLEAVKQVPGRDSVPTISESSGSALLAKAEVRRLKAELKALQDECNELSSVISTKT